MEVSEGGWVLEACAIRFQTRGKVRGELIIGRNGIEVINIK